MFIRKMNLSAKIMLIYFRKKLEISKKPSETLCEKLKLQLINHLIATEFEVGLLLNFGKTPKIKRKVFSNHIKKYISNSAKSAFQS